MDSKDLIRYIKQTDLYQTMERIHALTEDADTVRDARRAIDAVDRYQLREEQIKILQDALNQAYDTIQN